MAKIRKAIKTALSENDISRKDFRKKGPGLIDVKKSESELASYKAELNDAKTKYNQSINDLSKKTEEAKKSVKDGIVSDEAQLGWRSAYDNASKLNSDLEKLSEKGNEVINRTNQSLEKVKEYNELGPIKKIKARREFGSEYADKLDDRMEKMPTKTAGKVDTKQGSSLVNATKPNEKMEPMSTLNPEEVNTSQGKSLVTAISENPVAQVTQNEILNTGVKDASSPSQLQQAVQISTEAKKEAEKLEGDIDESLVSQATVSAVPYGSLDTEDAESLASAQAGNTIPTEPTVSVQEKTVIPGDGSTVSNVVATEGPVTPSYTQVGTTQDVEQGIADMYARMNAQIPTAVVEKLGIQDYYPNAGRDIAVGTFSGSRIGSQTIYSGAGALLPMGLYDARKRALADAAKEKKKQLDKFYDVIETAPQYQKAVNESWNAWLNQNLAKHNFDPDKFLSDPNIRREYAKRLSNAKDITYWTTWADNYLKESDKKENYGTAEGIKIAGEIKMAIIDHMDEIASGEKSIKDFVDLDKAKLYGNIIPQLDTVAEQALSAANMGEMPINMRTGLPGMDPEEFAQQRDEFMIKLKSGSLGNDEYLSGFKKFFTGNYEQFIDGLIKSGKFSEEQRDAALNYFAGRMQEQVKLKHEFIKNDQMEAARLAQQQKQWEAEFNYKVEQGQTPWTVQNEMMNKPNPASGKTMQQELLEAKRKGLTGTKLQAYMLRKARERGIANAEWDPALGTLVIKSPASPHESNQFFNINTTNKESFIKLIKVTKVNGKTVKTPVSVPLSEFINDKAASSKYYFTDGSKVTDNDLSAWGDAYRGNKLAIKPSSYESYYGVAGSVTGKQRPVTSTTIKDYDPKRGVNIKNSVGTAYSLVPIEGQPGANNAIVLKGTVFVPADISDPLQRRGADQMFGNDASQFKYTLQGGESSSSSGSMNYQNQ